MSAKLVVLGGNGFIGREVCRQAIEHGHRVVGLGRSGRPGVSAPWAGRVDWVAADVLRPEDWRGHLDGATAVVHSIAILRESASRGWTYGRVNGDSAVLAAREAAAAGAQRFVFVSVSAKPPLVPDEFIEAKRRAEQELHDVDIASVVLGPGFVTGSGRPLSGAVGAVTRLAGRLPGVGGMAREVRPLPVEVVARCALRAALEPQIRGTLDIDDIERLGTVAG